MSSHNKQQAHHETPKQKIVVNIHQNDTSTPQPLLQSALTAALPPIAIPASVDEEERISADRRLTAVGCFAAGAALPLSASPGEAPPAVGCAGDSPAPLVATTVLNVCMRDRKSDGLDPWKVAMDLGCVVPFSSTGLSLPYMSPTFIESVQSKLKDSSYRFFLF